MAEQLLPVVKLFFPCEEAVYDAPASRYTIYGPLHTVALPSAAAFPFAWDDLPCHAQLTDAIGTFRFSIELLAEATDVVSRRSPPVALTFPVTSRIAVVETVFRLTEMRFQSPGLYRLRLMCNHRPLADGEVSLRFLGGTHS
jgi:hypothetical protein